MFAPTGASTKRTSLSLPPVLGTASCSTCLKDLRCPSGRSWLTADPSRVLPADTFPVFNLLVDEGRFYGFPVHGVPGFKFGKYHHLEEKVDPETVDREAHDYDERLCRTSRSVTSSTAAARRWTCRPACSPTLRTTTSS